MSLSRPLVAVVLGLFSAIGFAQDWPVKPVKFVVPFPPGGTVDHLTALLAQ